MSNFYTVKQKHFFLPGLLLGISLIGLFIPLVVNAGGDGVNSQIQALEKRATTLQQEIVELIGNASCSSDAQCKTLPIGHRPCGGPAAYLAYSLFLNEEEMLREKAQEHTSTVREINRIKGLMSTCDMLMPPPVQCVDQRCQIQDQGHPLQ